MAHYSRRQMLRSLAAGVTAAAAASGLSVGGLSRANGSPLDKVSVLDHGVIGDGHIDDRSAIQDVIQKYGGLQPIVFPAGRYRIGTAGAVGPNRIVLPSGTHLNFEDGAVVEVNAVDHQTGTAVFYAGGSDGPKIDLGVEASAGLSSVKLPVGAGGGFQPGDIFGIESTGIAGDYAGGGPWYVRELREITAVDKDTVHLDAPLEYTYSPHEDAVFWKVHTVNNIAIHGATFECGPGVEAGTDGTYPVRITKAKNFSLNRIQLRSMIGGIAIHDGYHGEITNCLIDGLPRYIDSYGYGVHIAGGSSMVNIDNLRGFNNRHLFTTLADQRGSTFWGGPMRIKINKGIGHGARDGYSVWDTHEFGRHIEFNYCLAVGGGEKVSGFQMRAQDVQLNSCTAIENGFRAVHLHNRSRRVTVHGGEFGKAGAQGLAIAGAHHRVVGAYIHDCGSSGVALLNSEDVSLESCVIANNSTGIQDGGAETSSNAPIRASDNARIQDCMIPFSETQTVSISNLSVSAQVDGCVCLGYRSIGGMFDSAANSWGVPQGARYSTMTSEGWISNTLA